MKVLYWNLRVLDQGSFRCFIQQSLWWFQLACQLVQQACLSWSRSYIYGLVGHYARVCLWGFFLGTVLVYLLFVFRNFCFLFRVWFSPPLVHIFPFFLYIYADLVGMSSGSLMSSSLLIQKKKRTNKIVSLKVTYNYLFIF
jgi:hypothetical protein